MAEIRVCDLCGRALRREELRHFKVKELKFCSWTRIDAHDECVKKLLLGRQTLYEEVST